MGPVGAGAGCCCAMIDAAKITTAIATGAPTALRMFLSMIRVSRNLLRGVYTQRAVHCALIPFVSHRSGCDYTPRQ